MIHYECDIAVAGAGPAGSVAAIILARAGFRVILIEGSMYDRPRIGENIPPLANPLLQRLGVWELFMTLNPEPSFANQSAWGGEELLMNSFLFDPYGNGWHVDRQIFDAMLAGTASSAGAILLTGSVIRSCDFKEEGHWIINIGNEGGNKVIKARALIDATGRKACITKRQGIRRATYDQLVGSAVLFQNTVKSQGFILIEATPDGYWYSAPVPGNGLVIMFFCDAAFCRQHRLQEPGNWNAYLQKTLHNQERINGCVKQWGPRISSASSYRVQRREWNKPWLACGDAAIGVDPLSSSGILRAMQTGEAGAITIGNWLKGEADAILTYENMLDNEYKLYLEEHKTYYSMEKRWPEREFWKQRSAIWQVSDL